MDRAVVSPIFTTLHIYKWMMHIIAKFEYYIYISELNLIDFIVYYQKKGVLWFNSFVTPLYNYIPKLLCMPITLGKSDPASHLTANSNNQRSPKINF